MDPFRPERAREVLRDLLTRAGRIALDHQRSAEARMKPDGSPVTGADKLIDAWLGEQLALAFPGVGVIGEEGAYSEGPAGTFHLDPIDGTHAYLQRLAYWGPTVALVQGGELVFGAFYVPTLDEYWFAARGMGAFRDDERLGPRVHDAPARHQVLFVPSRFHRHPALPWPGKVRALGSSAAHLAHVAAGAGVATVIPQWALWDVGCGALLITESGGALRRLDGGPIDVVNGPQGLPFVAGAPGALEALSVSLAGRTDVEG
jgi:myo-inositol-1(or 4)-monophosphatase